MGELFASVDVRRLVYEASKDIVPAWSNFVSVFLNGPGIAPAQRCHFVSTMGATVAMIVATGFVRVFVLKHLKRTVALEMSVDIGTAALAISIASVSAMVLCGIAARLPFGLTPHWIYVPIFFSIAVYALIIDSFRQTTGQPRAIRLSAGDKIQILWTNVLSVTLGLLSLGLGVGLIITERSC